MAKCFYKLIFSQCHSDEGRISLVYLRFFTTFHFVQNDKHFINNI
ncbi:hypothetical protein ACFP3I_02225 [Chryseobacterium arachidis]